MCGTIQREAERHDLPPSFLARLINRESRFDDRAVSPVGALGIAQFMPGTAAMVGLADPLNSDAAIPAAAAHLADLRKRFGNLGLAAAAYNAGPGGVQLFLGTGRLPAETRAYVRAITGKPVKAFRAKGAKLDVRPLARGVPFLAACTALPSYRMPAPSPMLAAVPLGLSLGRGPRAAAKRDLAGPAAPVPAATEAAVRTGAVASRAPTLAERLTAAAVPIAEAMRAARAEADELAATPVPAVFADRTARPVPAREPVVVAAAGAVEVPATLEATAPTVVAAATISVPTGEGWRRMIGPPTALDVPLREGATKAERNRQICGLIERESQRVGMDPAFFARLINQESRFDPNARSPVGAQGVAQFMPYTAKERGLANPFDIVQAIPASADYLAELKGMLGNWGLAAMAYNAGPGRIIDVFGGRAPPPETRNYIQIITSRDWRHFTMIENEVEAVPLDAALPFMDACVKLPTKRMSPPKPAGPDVEPWQPWGVQLAASFVESSAVASFDRQVKRYGSVLEGRRPLLIRTKMRGTRRAKIAARLGAPNRAEADALCAQIKRAGGACVVMKNTR